MTGILLLVATGSHAQTTSYTGKVIDPAGSPVPGATIKIKGLKGGTSAGADGTFKLNAPPNAVFFVSGVGFRQEVKTAGTTS